MNFRKCEVVQQVNFLPGFPDWQQTLKENLASRDTEIKNWAYILHDKDLGEDGLIKASHIHLVLELNDSYQASTIGGFFGVPGQHVGKIKQSYKSGNRWFADVGGALSYLTHRNAKDRYQYSDEEVVAKQGFDWIAVRNKSEMQQLEHKSFMKVLNEIEEGKIRRFNLFETVSLKQYIDHKSEFEKAFEFRQGKIQNDANRDINIFFITGEPGSGKSTLAKKVCEKKNLSYCLSGSSRDPMQNYAGQDVLILDDLRPTVFPISDLLKLLDNHSSSAVSSRYRDKWLEVSFIIITTVLSIEAFFLGIGASEEPISQLKRRCKTLVELNRQTIQIFFYNEKTQKYKLISTGANPITELFAKEDVEATEEHLIEICNDFGLEYKPDKQQTV